MEKIRIDIQLNPAQVLSRQQLMQALKENEDVLAFLSKHQLDTSFVDKYVGKFSDYVEVCNTCKKCNGLKNCPYGIQGEYRDLDVQNGKLVITSKMCSYLKEHDNRFAHMKQYVMNHLREDLYEVDFNKIALENESIDYLKSYALIKEWSINPTKGLYFYGGFGVGKTYLAACISNGFARNGKTVAFINSSEFCNEMRMNWNQNDYLQDAIRTLKNVDLLVVDDIGSEIVTNWVRDELLFPIFDDRMGNHKLTIFTSNYNYDELLNHFMYNNKGEKDEINALRLMERVKSMSTLVQIKGKNRRF